MIVEYTCAICGKPGKRRYAKGKVPSTFLCSKPCQHEWQKCREDISIKNKDPEFRKKVSEGLKRRKAELGNDYHSTVTKRKIGMATAARWKQYDDSKRERLAGILAVNARKKRTYGPYDNDWHRMSSQLREQNYCHRCGSHANLCIHHIIPASSGGTRDLKNLVPLCASCHRIVEAAEKAINKLVCDWEIVALIVRERLGVVNEPKESVV